MEREIVNYSELNEYIRQGEPDRVGRAYAWQTAIGLQDVDGLQTSPYLLETAKKHIEGEISIVEANARIQKYYEASSKRSGEYKVVTDALDITPHAGVRLMYLHTDEYDVKSAGQKLYKGDDINQTIWSFPVGVTFSKCINMDNGWYVKPSLDLQVTPRAGDVHAKNDIKYTGLNTSASIETQTMDYVTYGGAVGVELGNDTVKLGLNYNLEAGAHTTNHGVFGTLRYEF